MFDTKWIVVYVHPRTSQSEQEPTEYVVKIIRHSSCHQVEPTHSKYTSPDQRPHYGSQRSSSPYLSGEFYSILVSWETTLEEFTRSVFQLSALFIPVELVIYQTPLGHV